MPIWFAFDFGQINFLLWALIVFDLAVLAPRHSRFLGVGIGLATAIKLVPGIFILYLLISGRRRGTIVAAATAAVATLIAAAAAPGDSVAYWTKHLLNGDGVGQLFYVMNQSLNGVGGPARPARDAVDVGVAGARLAGAGVRHVAGAAGRARRRRARRYGARRFRGQPDQPADVVAPHLLVRPGPARDDRHGGQPFVRAGRCPVRAAQPVGTDGCRCGGAWHGHLRHAGLLRVQPCATRAGWSASCSATG